MIRLRAAKWKEGLKGEWEWEKKTVKGKEVHCHA